MRSVGVSRDVPAPKGLAELNHHNRVDLKEGRNGAPFDGHGMSEEDESIINEDVNIIRPKELGQARAALNRQHQQPQGPVVQWQSFLPVRILKVLLVESDRSTRHVVTALLRNCGYEVTAVANGLEAWKLLIDPNKQIDLVLTEVVMPYLSGIGLLSKITNHDTRKNIPVIMMSSDDSMGIVFNCLSKGAVDFLVKPIRKNELKNLWQHVWRKCHSSSGSGGGGSGSESGIRDLKSTKSRSVEEYDGDSENIDKDDITNIELNAKGGSDNGSGTQSSWPKRIVEVDSSQGNCLWEKAPNPHDITSAQVASPKTSKLATIDMGKDLEIGVPDCSNLEVEELIKNKTDKFSGSNMKRAGDQLDISMQLVCENGASSTEPLNAHKEASKANHSLENINIKDKSSYYSKELPALELTLKRPRDVEDADVSGQERNVLRHSGPSAFSRYNTVSNINQTPTGNVDSCSPPGISSEAANPNNILSNSNGTPNHRSNGSGDLDSTTNNAFTTKSDGKPLPSNLAIVFHDQHTSTLQPLIPYADKGDVVKTIVAQANADVQNDAHVRHYHHFIYVCPQDLPKIMNLDEGSLRNMVSSVLTGSAEGNAANNGSASGSDNKSNGENGGSWQNGNGFAPIVQGSEIGNGIGGPIIINGGYGSGSGSGSGVDQERLTRREEAVKKYLKKRKERCFAKKVLYHSRQKLAEQRPRFRGQFVRHGAKGVNNEDADS